MRYIVDDVGAAVGFYVDRLGFQEKERYGPAMAIVERDGLRRWLAGPAASASRPMPDGRLPASGGWNRLVVEVDNLDELVDRLRAAGVTFRTDPISVSGPGGRQVLIEDPSGNPVELFQP